MTTIYDPRPVTGFTFDSDTDSYGSEPAKFDAYLYKPSAASVGGALKLTIQLRINLWQATPLPLRLDADGNEFPTSPWHDTAWQRFLGQAREQADMWNGKFWLVAPTVPAIFSDFDRTFDTFPGQAFRPNVVCELSVDFKATSNSHRTIEVVQLDTDRLLPGVPRDALTFRSDAALYDSLDGVPAYVNFAPGQRLKYYVIAHELGHALGLGHIGRLLKTPLCRLAIAARGTAVERLLPDAAGGPDSAYCYGFSQGVGVGGNVMGSGSAFTAENARPWLWAIQRMYPWGLWRAVTVDPGPGTWIRT
jgi:hypothetical protein